MSWTDEGMTSARRMRPQPKKEMVFLTRLSLIGQYSGYVPLAMVFVLARSDTLRIAHRSRRSFPDPGPGSSMPWMMKAYSRSPKWSSNSKSATNIAAYPRRICCRMSRKRLWSQQKVILSARQTSSGRDSPALTIDLRDPRIPHILPSRNFHATATRT